MARKRKVDVDFRPRQYERRPPRQRFLILCEGNKTEPLYFRAFRVPRDLLIVKVVEGLGGAPLQIVARAIEMRDAALGSPYEYDQVWCVFDKDDISPQEFNRAIQRARSCKLHVAYSNEAFELWYLLHFDFYHAAISRTTYKQRLTERLGRAYKKNDPEMYALLATHQRRAIDYAEQLLECYPRRRPAYDNPSTTVHLLVKELVKYATP